MSILALYPIVLMISRSVRRHLGKSWEGMQPYEKEELGDFILRRLSALYGIGRAPTVRREGSPECKEMERVIRHEIKTKEGERRMERAIDRIIRQYASEVEEPELIFPPHPLVKKKKKIEVLA